MALSLRAESLMGEDVIADYEATGLSLSAVRKQYGTSPHEMVLLTVMVAPTSLNPV